MSDTYVVSGVFTKQIPSGINIQHAQLVIEASSEEESLGFFVIKMSEELPDHQLFIRPLVMSLSRAEQIVRDHGKDINLIGGKVNDPI